MRERLNLNWDLYWGYSRSKIGRVVPAGGETFAAKGTEGGALVSPYATSPVALPSPARGALDSTNYRSGPDGFEEAATGRVAIGRRR